MVPAVGNKKTINNEKTNPSDLPEKIGSYGLDNEWMEKNLFQYIKVRSLIFWSLILGIPMYVLLNYPSSFQRICDGDLFFHIACIILYSWIFLWILWKFRKYNISLKTFIGKLPKKRNWRNWTGITAGQLLFSMGAGYLSWYLISFLYPEYVEAYLRQDNLFVSSEGIPKSFFIIIIECFMIIAVAPFFEELMFRGIIFQRWENKWGVRKAIILTALLFGALHDDIIGAAFFSFVMSVLYMQTRTLWVPILCHVVNNGIAVLLAGVDEIGLNNYFSGLPEFQSHVWIGILCFCAAFPWVAMFIRKHGARLKPSFIPVQTDLPVYSKFNNSPVHMQTSARKTKWGFVFALILVCIFMIGTAVYPIAMYNYQRVYPAGNSQHIVHWKMKQNHLEIPEIMEFERLFPKYYVKLIWEDPKSPDYQTWILSAGLYQRYLISMSIKVHEAAVDSQTGFIQKEGSWDKPAYSLWEVTSVTPPSLFSRDRFVRLSQNLVHTISADEWKVLAESSGDLSKIGIKLKKNEPIPNFELAYQESN